MDSYPWVLVVGLAVATVIATLMIWRGRGGEITFGPKGLRIGVRQQSRPEDKVIVANRADIGGEVGTIVGNDARKLRSDNGRLREIIVADHLVVRPGGKVGAIVGGRTGEDGAAPGEPPK